MPRSVSPRRCERVTVSAYRGARHEAPLALLRFAGGCWPSSRLTHSGAGGAGRRQSCTPIIARRAMAPTGSAGRGRRCCRKISAACWRPRAAAVIAEGRAATQMPGFGADAGQGRDRRAGGLYCDAARRQSAAWGEREIAASRVIHAASAGASTGRAYDADPMNLFVVVETGDHHATILDGDRFEPLARFPTRFALHGGPKFTPDGRYVFFMSRDGWVSKYDLWTLTMLAEVRAGINSRNIAISRMASISRSRIICRTRLSSSRPTICRSRRFSRPGTANGNSPRACRRSIRRARATPSSPR